jgi:hypothetical protein
VFGQAAVEKLNSATGFIQLLVPEMENIHQYKGRVTLFLQRLLDCRRSTLAVRIRNEIIARMNETKYPDGHSTQINKEDTHNLNPAQIKLQTVANVSCRK